MPPRPSFITASVRLVSRSSPAAGERRYRPLVCGSAVLRRPERAAAWTVSLACDRRLRPRVPCRSVDLERLVAGLARREIACRVAATLAAPCDPPLVTASQTDGVSPPRWPPRPCFDIYGWALMYQPPGMRGRALVDAADGSFDLPAVFELPLELIDRADFLESRGYRTRPLLIPAQPADFVPGPDGRPRNRFFPDAAFRHPARLDGLL